MKQAKLKVESIAIGKLKPHPRNYREHPADQLEHLIHSIKKNGFYRNIVTAKDFTILAGHGVVAAAQKMEMKFVPVIRLNIEADSPSALKVLAGDNEVGHLIEVNDRALTEILKELNEDADGLLGTGYDAQMLAALAMVTRPESEIKDFDEAAHWAGMPEFGSDEKALKIYVLFRNRKDRAAFAKRVGLKVPEDNDRWSTWWPSKEKDDPSSVQFSG
jgi:hypothetical protein